MKLRENQQVGRDNVTDLFPRNRNLSDDSDSRCRQLARDIRQLRRRDLIERYPLEWNCFRAMHQRARTGIARVHSDFRRFQDFLLSLGPCPAKNYTVDRINTFDPEYAPGKVRWASKVEQAYNRSSTTMLRHSDGRIKPLAEWAKVSRQKPDTLRKRLERGWTDMEIIRGSRSPISAGDVVRDQTATTGRWPGIVQDERKWESAWRSWDQWTNTKPYYKLSRDEFFLWIATNKFRSLEARLARRFPDQVGDDADPEYTPRKPLTDDPEYLHYRRVYDAMRDVQSRVVLKAHNPLSVVLRKYHQVSNPQAVMDLISAERVADHGAYTPSF